MFLRKNRLGGAKTALVLDPILSNHCQEDRKPTKLPQDLFSKVIAAFDILYYFISTTEGKLILNLSKGNFKV